jgi:FlaG/FlaF family flagellin (archaellin)
MTTRRRAAGTGTGKSEGSQGPKHRKLSRKQKTIAWAGSLAGVALGAFATAFFGAFGNQAAAFVSSVDSHAGSAGHSAGAPAAIDYVGFEQSSDAGEVVAFPKSVTLSARQLKTLDSMSSYHSSVGWLETHGGVNTFLNILVVVQGNRSHKVRIVNIQPVASCAKPLRGTLFYSPSAGAGPVTQLNLDLDKPMEPLSYVASYEVDGAWTSKEVADYFNHYTISLDPGEQFTFAVHATTQLHYCRFSLNMTVVDGTRTMVEPITDHGRQFQITAVYGKYSPAFSRYSTVYFGGVASPDMKTDGWTRVDPTKVH